MANFFTKFIDAIKSMVTGNKPEKKPEKIKSHKRADVGREREGVNEHKIPEKIRRKEFDHWDRFEDFFEDVESLGETEYDETI